MEKPPQSPDQPSDHEKELAHAQELFEEVSREMEQPAEPKRKLPDIRTGDPEKLEQLRKKMRDLYPLGHKVPEKVGKPFSQPRREQHK